MRKQSQRKLNEYQQHGEAWDGTGRDPPNVRKAKKGKSNKTGKPMCIDKMDDKRMEAELGEIWRMKPHCIQFQYPGMICLHRQSVYTNGA